MKNLPIILNWLKKLEISPLRSLPGQLNGRIYTIAKKTKALKPGMMLRQKR